MKFLLPTCFVMAMLCFFSSKIAAQNPVVVILGPPELDNCYLVCGTYEASILNMTPPFTYQWFAPNGYSSAQSKVFFCANSGPSSGGGAINLTVVVTDANGNTATDDFVIIIKNNVIPVQGDIIPACDNCNGAITTLNLPAGTCNEYSWSNGQNTPNLIGLCPGLYIITVTNCQSNCTSIGEFIVPGSGIAANLISDNPNPCNQPDSSGIISSCEKVCAGQTVTYFAQFATPDTSNMVDWTISGAVSFEIEPNYGQSVTVVWPNSGGGNVLLQTTGACGGEVARCVQVTDAPVAKIGSSPFTNNNLLTICENQPVYFVNQSINATYVEWDFGDFSQKNYQNKPSHAYSVAGNYKVRLIAKSECYCVDTTYFNVKVVNGAAPMLDCIGTVCAGTAVTYSTNPNCGSFVWQVSSEGTILGGGGNTNSVTVQWNSGELGEISLTALACNPAVCPIPAVYQVPIISDDAQIIGDERVCPNEESVYEISPFGGANFVWTLASGGQITEGQGSNRIKIHWTNPSNTTLNHWLSVSYNNCYLGCGGQDSISVKILPQYAALGDFQICENANANFTNKTIPGNAVIPLDWMFFDKNETPVFSINNQASPSIPMNFGSGNITIKTTPTNPALTCTDVFSLNILVKNLPAALAGISGESNICPSQSYTYLANGLSSGRNAIWQITGGTPTVHQGENVVIKWDNSGNYSILAKQKTADALGCESPAIPFLVNKLSAPIVLGDPVLCAQTLGTYGAPFSQNVDYQWVITPSDAGTVVDGQGTNQAIIFWYKAGTHAVSVFSCNQTSADFAVIVNPLPEPVAVAPAIICENATANVSTTLPFSTYLWKNENGLTASTLPIPSLGSGHFELEVTDGNGCRGDSTFFIDVRPTPKINISSPDLEIFCPAEGFNLVRIYATDTDEGLDYQWFMDNNLTGTNANLLNVMSAGSYQVVATDSDGCSSISNILNIFGCNSGGAGGGTGPPGGGLSCPIPAVDFNILPTAQCDLRNYAGIILGSGFTPNSQQWFFENNELSNLMNPTKNYAQAGYKKVFFGANFGNNFCWIYKPDSVVLAADFKEILGCAGETVLFEDISTFLPPTSIAFWQWDFGDLASGSANISTQKNPNHIFSVSGNFTISLTVTSSSGCTSIFSKTLAIGAPPSASIVDPTENCAGNALEFDANSPNNDIAEWKWDFDDFLSGDANTSTVVPAFHKFNAPGNYLIKLSAKNIAGCRANFTKNFTVVANPLVGNVILNPANGKICEGKTATLTAPAGGIAWVWSDGSTANSLIINEEGNYSVTATDQNGCTFTPAEAIVKVIPAPDGSIVAFEKTDFGGIAGVFDTPYMVCDGDNVFLEASGNDPGYQFTWSNSTSGSIIEFSDIRGNLLSTGTHVFEVTITEASTGCTNTTPVFTVEVNPTPAQPTIFVAPAGQLCSQVNHLFSVINPNNSLVYEWNTGQTGAFFQSDEAGLFNVVATNSAGCSAKSTSQFVEMGAPVDAIPAGCLTRCKPDTLCFTLPPNVTGWQWLFNGNPVSSPSLGNQFIAQQTGTYTVQLTASNGCTALSDPLTLDLQLAFGSVLGQVFSDVNYNGIIDPLDTLIGGMPVQLLESSTIISDVLSNTYGIFSFVNVPSLPYSVSLDIPNLPAGWSAIIGTDDASLSGCDDEVLPQLLVNFCQQTTDSTRLSICAGDSLFVQNTWIMAGNYKNFDFKNQYGCDSLITVIISAKQVPVPTQIQMLACSGDTVFYQNTPVVPGTSADFLFSSWTGCDSIVTVSAATYPPINLTKISIPACAGSLAIYQNIGIPAGSTQSFILKNLNGCDSTVQVTAVATQPSAANLNLSVCAGQTVDYQGFTLGAGDSKTFDLTNVAGCDSVLTVNVAGLPPLDFLVKITNSCLKNATGTIEFLPISGSTPFVFSTDGGINFQDSALFLNLAVGQKSVQMRDTNDCFFEKMIEIEAIPTLFAQLENRQLTCDSAVIQLMPMLSGADSTTIFKWIDSDGVAVGNAAILPVNSAGKYFFSATNICETATANSEITFDEQSIGSTVYLPNAFDPTSEDLNKSWHPFFSNQVQVLDYQLFVFDRWGNLVFSTTDPAASWDGIYRGKRLNPGVYVYSIEASVDVCRQQRKIKKKGDLTIVR